MFIVHTLSLQYNLCTIYFNFYVNLDNSQKIDWYKSLNYKLLLKNVQAHNLFFYQDKFKLLYYIIFTKVYFQNSWNIYMLVDQRDLYRDVWTLTPDLAPSPEHTPRPSNITLGMSSVRLGTARDRESWTTHITAVCLD